VKPLLVFAAVLLALAVPAAQDSQPLFRAGVDLITVDVAAVDSRGRPVSDLKPGDFVVKVDGKARPIVSAELIKVERGKPAAARPVDILESTNQRPKNARRIIVAVDQTLITPGSLAPLQRTASQFLDRLQPEDYAAFVAFPEPGPRIDFTTDKARVRSAMEEIVGQPQAIDTGTFNISLTEALAITGAESIEDSSDPREFTAEALLSGPMMRRVLQQGCRGSTIEELQLENPPAKLRQCRRDVYSESLTLAQGAKIEADISRRALEQLLKDLASLEGPKTMIVFSAGLVNDDPSVLEEVIHLAAAARTSINVIAVDRNRDQEVRNMASGQSTLSTADRSLETQGLEIIADSTGGTLFRGVAAGAGIFERLESELSAWYLLAVARRPGDPDRQRVGVEVKRRGVTIRSNSSVISTQVNTKRPDNELLGEALSSPFAIAGVPLRVSTFALRDADGGKYRLRLAAQIGAPGEPAGEFALGYVLTDSRGRPVTNAGVRRQLSPAANGGPNQRLQYDTVLSVDPGSYLLRFGVVDKDGRRGTVVHRVELAKFADVPVPTSDLIVGNLPAEGESLTPRVEPQVTTSTLAGYLELYLPDDVIDLEVDLEIAEGESSPALATGAMALRAGEAPSSRVATGLVATAMSPGRYLARAVVRRDGVTVKTLTRPITIVRDPSVVTTPTTRPAVVTRTPARPRGVPITAELRSRTGSYVAGVVNGLANIVGQEAFTLSSPGRRVTSDLLLVRYPGSTRDLLAYRDVIQLNGKPVPGREQRLIDLFITPPGGLRERARQIMADSEAHVPSVFNPMFALAFLQSAYQSQFELTVNDAGPTWPREVKAVTFVEVRRPTVLRRGPLDNIDLPTRGTAWIEEGTGRVLQTELIVGEGRSAQSMLTKFQLDERLQVTVPVEMRTQNPDGVAVYSNFRRFGVDTDATIKKPPTPK
jgi:VWFA-related protein